MSETDNNTPTKSGWSLTKKISMAVGAIVVAAGAAGAYLNQGKLVEVGKQAKASIEDKVEEFTEAPENVPEPIAETTPAIPTVNTAIDGLGACEGVQELTPAPDYQIQTTMVCKRAATLEEVKAGGTIPKG